MYYKMYKKITINIFKETKLIKTIKNNKFTNILTQIKMTMENTKI